MRNPIHLPNRPRPAYLLNGRRLSRLVLPAALTAWLAVGCSGPGERPQPHPEEAAVVAVVEQLFEAMRTNDGEMAAAVFHPEARLGRATDEGISFGPVDGFVEAVGRPKDQVWDEPIWDWTVRVDGRLAQMWTKYAFYLDDAFSHCGSDAFDLYKSDSGWQVVQLVDTSRRDECWHPPGREPAEGDAAEGEAAGGGSAEDGVAEDEPAGADPAEDGTEDEAPEADPADDDPAERES